MDIFVAVPKRGKIHIVFGDIFLHSQMSSCKATKTTYKTTFEHKRENFCASCSASKIFPGIESTSHFLRHPFPPTSSCVFFKGTVQRDFWPLVFFHNSNLPGPLINGLKYFRVWLSIRGVIRFLGLEKLTPRGMIPRRVKQKFDPRAFIKKIKNVAL